MALAFESIDWVKRLPSAVRVGSIQPGEDWMTQRLRKGKLRSSLSDLQNWNVHFPLALGLGRLQFSGLWTQSKSCSTGSSGFETFGLGQKLPQWFSWFLRASTSVWSSVTDSAGFLLCWLQTAGLPSLRRHVSQFLIINLFMCTHIKYISSTNMWN